MATPPHANGIIDTDILIDAMHGLPNAITFLDEQRNPGIQISIISAMELIAGCRNKAEITELQKFLQKIILLPITPTASEIAYQLVTSFYHSHGLHLPDALIAATALEYDLTLYTRNTRHFRPIPRLTVRQPY